MLGGLDILILYFIILDFLQSIFMTQPGAAAKKLNDRLSY